MDNETKKRLENIEEKLYEATRLLSTLNKSSFQSLLDRRNAADLPSADAQDRLKHKSGMQIP